MLGELNDVEIKNILSSQVVGRIACTDGVHPYIVPVTYTYDGQYIYGQTTAGKKLDMLRKNPNVCFEIDLMIDMRNWQSIIVYGKFEEMSNADATKVRQILYDRIFSLSASTTVHSFGEEPVQKIEEGGKALPVLYRISISKITGRFEKL
jgi:nitroimidazol reductase NimA-like FMN-containing flavoprotein (pyridoxamine 5'-phosphate oxidase superfamily)